MRCPYCGVVNKDGAAFCTHCGRDLVRPTQPQTGAFPPQAPSYPPGGRQQTMPTARTGPAPQRVVYPAGPSTPPTGTYQRGPQQTQPVNPQSTATPPPPISYAQTSTPTAPSQRPRTQSVNEPPAPFPPKTIAQLHQLEAGALTYAVIDNTISYGRRKVVRIKYARCSTWQQIATLSKAWREYDDATLDTIIIQGVFDTATDSANSYGYTNGQLLFNRNVRLGSQVLQRYQIETGNGFESDSLRLVLSE
jgi:hypothetical protein